jgi:DNA-binding Xre family transcriptional regulator
MEELMPKTKRIMNKFNLLLAEKAYREGVAKIPRDDVITKTGLAKTTVDRIARQEVTMYANHVVIAMCEYFGCEIGDFLAIEEIEEYHRIPAFVEHSLAAR